MTSWRFKELINKFLWRILFVNHKKKTLGQSTLNQNVIPRLLKYEELLRIDLSDQHT